MLQDWDTQTYRFWLEMLEKERKDVKVPKAGVKVRCPFSSMILHATFP